MTTVVRELRERVDAAPATIGHTREVLAEWARAAHIGERQRADLLLATYEAMANSTEHAYHGHGGLIDIHAYRTPHTVVVTVTDYGDWCPPHDDGERGRGLPLIKGLAHQAEITHRDAGTTVRMRWHV